MKSVSRVFEGPAFHLFVEEINERGRDGRTLLYLASLYLQVRGRTRMHLVRRSRIPGAAVQLEQDAKLGKIDIGRLVDVVKIDGPAV
jgi:hypothetical protein